MNENKLSVGYLIVNAVQFSAYALLFGAPVVIGMLLQRRGAGSVERKGGQGDA